MNYHKNKDIILPLSLFLLTVITRIPFTSKYLYHMDSVQFALALENYDITAHQPHPPGYFLYVMLGRLVNLFIKDANTTFIFISILFSGIAVVVVFFLGKEIFDKKTGIFAALIALTSPNLWFHGEVALTYVVEAFFSSFVALLCWRIIKGQHKYLWLSVIALGIAGGIRQNTVVFLLPLWLFSVKGVPLRKIITSLGLLGIVCLLWFIPMVWMTGGWNAYQSALRELWLFNTGHVSVFEKGWPLFLLFASTLFDFTFYGIGSGIFILGLAAYSLMRFGYIKALDRTKFFFFLLWTSPSVFFYLFIFILRTNPGYALIFLPSLFILIAAAIGLVSKNLEKVFLKDVSGYIVTIILIINTAIFLFSEYPVSHYEIRTHDGKLSVMLSKIKTFDPSTTAIFVGPYTFYGYRQIMYYEPAYAVYQVDIRVTPTGDVRKNFWGKNKETHLTDKINIPPQIHNLMIPLFLNDMAEMSLPEGLTIGEILPDFFLVSGPVRLIKAVYPGLHIVFPMARIDDCAEGPFKDQKL
jgi:Dolichyl-phosphate-mannose-protein mannosyltransferase